MSVLCRRRLSGKKQGIGMVGSLIRLATAVLFAGALAGCATSPEVRFSDAGNRSNYGAKIQSPDMPNECVPYARARSGVSLRGDANTWWAQAAGRYARETSPA